jgi:hypothetical protein
MEKDSKWLRDGAFRQQCGPESPRVELVQPRPHDLVKVLGFRVPSYKMELITVSSLGLVCF